MPDVSILSNLRNNGELTISNNKVTVSFKKYDIDTIIKLLTDLRFAISEDGYIFYNEDNKYLDPYTNKELLAKDAIICIVRTSDSPMFERLFPISNSGESISHIIYCFGLNSE